MRKQGMWIALAVLGIAWLPSQAQVAGRVVVGWETQRTALEAVGINDQPGWNSRVALCARVISCHRAVACVLEIGRIFVHITAATAIDDNPGHQGIRVAGEE